MGRATSREAMLTSPVRVETPTRIVLRPLAEADREAFVEVIRASRESLDRFAPLHQEGESDESVFERQLFLTQEGERTGRACRRLCVLDDGRIAGACNLNSISRGLEMRADINVWVASSMAGRGIATRALRMLMDHALAPLPDGLGLHLIEAGARRSNAASVRVLEKLGFSRAGEERSHLRTGSEWTLHDIYSYRLGATG